MSNDAPDQFVRIFDALAKERRETAFHIEVPQFRMDMAAAGFSIDPGTLDVFVNGAKRIAEENGSTFGETIDDIKQILRRMAKDPEYKTRMMEIFENGLPAFNSSALALGQ